MNNLLQFYSHWMFQNELSHRIMKISLLIRMHKLNDIFEIQISNIRNLSIFQLHVKENLSAIERLGQNSCPKFIRPRSDGRPTFVAQETFDCANFRWNTVKSRL